MSRRTLTKEQVDGIRAAIAAGGATREIGLCFGVSKSYVAMIARGESSWGGAPIPRTKWVRHGLTDSATYASWGCMRNRCYNPRDKEYANYGGRGIAVCEEWRDSFATFVLDMGERPGRDFTLERCDTNGNYTKANCRWATRAEQSFNRRVNHFIEIDGHRKCLAEWARHFGLRPALVSRRINAMGWDEIKALTTPVLPVGRRSERT